MASLTDYLNVAHDDADRKLAAFCYKVKGKICVLGAASDLELYSTRQNQRSEIDELCLLFSFFFLLTSFLN